MLSRKFISMLGVVCLAASAHGQESQTSSASTATFRAETKLVLVDAVVTDKKGNYVSDLEQKDFKLWEDGKEQPISSFSLEQHNVSNAESAPQYMVLLFDNSGMSMGDQAKARDAALKFVDANAAPGRLIAVVDFGGTIRISQNFTAVPDRLKQAVKSMQNSFVSSGVGDSFTAGTSPVASLSALQSDFGIHSVLLAVLNVARSLSAVPGRKTLVLLTSGFPLNFEYEAEVAATIAACNKANVAVYPIDVRGLTADVPVQHSWMQAPTDANSPKLLRTALFRADGAHLQLASWTRPYGFFDPQKGGTGQTGPAGGGTGTHPPASGGPGVNRPIGPTSGYVNDMSILRSSPQPKVIVPEVSKSAADNQQVMYQIADGTGGFVIVNSNDLIGGLGRIAKDQTQYYLLGYKPVEPDTEGHCHTIKVKVNRGGTEVRARSGYCNVRPLDSLAGSPVEKDLESHATTASLENAGASMKAPFFYTSANTARVDLAVDIPPSALSFAKEKGKQHATVNILGVARKADGSVAARFSDSADVDLADKKQFEEFQKRPFRYETQFEIASGKYNLSVVFGTGNERFGKIEIPLTVDPYQEKQFSISGVALSNDIREAANLQLGLDSQLLEDKTPLLVQGLQVLPSASNRFKKTDTAAIYAEIYEPLLKDANPPHIAYELFIRDSKGAEKLHVGEEIKMVHAGNPVIPFAVRLPVSTLEPGNYEVELSAVDSAGNESATRKAEFLVE